MKIKLTSILVNDQSKALDFYTEVLGFQKKQDIPLGEYRWLSVVSPEGRDDLELSLEPAGSGPALTYQAALYEAGTPLTAFESSDVQRDYDSLVERGVVFKSGPTAAGPTVMAVFDDTCGNWIQIYQVQSP